MQINLRKSLSMVVVAGALCVSLPSFAANSKTTTEKKVEEVKAKTVEATRDAKRSAKKTARKVKDEACEMVNGKMECVGQKAKHTLQNMGDKIEDAVE